jgi:protein TonB
MTQQTVTANWRNAALAAAIVAALGIAGCGKKPAPTIAPTVGAPAATSSAPAAASAATAVSDADLLTKAKTAENEKRLYAPAGDNAIEYYLELRQRNPNDESAKSALTDLFPYAMIATEQNLKKGDEPGRLEAARIFALLERVDTNAPSLPRLRAMMQKEAGDELKQQQEAAQKAQADLEKKTATDKAAATAAAAAKQSPAAQSAATQSATPTPAPAQTNSQPQSQSSQSTSSQTAAQPRQTQPQAQVAPPPPAEPAPQSPPPKPSHAGLPDVVSSVQPTYPRDALRDGVSGEVTVAFTVNADGSVGGASVISSNPRRVFDTAALEAIRKWKFEAPGAPVSGKRTFAFNPGN